MTDDQALLPTPEPEPLQKRRTARALFAAAAVLLVIGVVAAAVLVAGGDDDTLETVAVGETVPVSRISRASATMESVSYRIEGTMTLPSFAGGAGGAGAPAAAMTMVTEYDARTGRSRSEVLGAEGAPSLFNIVTVNDSEHVYFRVDGSMFGQQLQLPEGKRWVRQRIPDEASESLEELSGLSGTAFLDAFIKEGATVTYLGTDEVRGTTTDRYRLAAADGTTGGEVWIDGDRRLRRIRIDGGGGQFSVDVSVVRFGGDIQVDLPPADEVIDEADVSMLGGETETISGSGQASS